MVALFIMKLDLENLFRKINEVIVKHLVVVG